MHPFLVSASEDGRISIWDLNSKRKLIEPTKPSLSLDAHVEPALALAFSPKGDILATASNDGLILLWDFTDSALAFALDPTSIAPKSEPAPNPSELESDNTTSKPDKPENKVERKKPRFRPFAKSKLHQSAVWSLAFSPDGRTLASGSADATARLWDISKGKHCPKEIPSPKCLEGHTHLVYTVAFAPSGMLLATGSYDKSIRLWSAAGDLILKLPDLHMSWIRALAFSPNGDHLASASTDCKLLLWTLRPWKPGSPPPAPPARPADLVGHDDAVWAIAFAPDGATLASASRDGKLRLWDVAAAAKAGAAEPLKPRETLESHKRSALAPRTHLRGSLAHGARRRLHGAPV